MNPADLTYTTRVREYIEVDKVVRPRDVYGTSIQIVHALNSALSTKNIVAFRPPCDKDMFLTTDGYLVMKSSSTVSDKPRLIFRPRLYAHDILGSAPTPEEKP